MRSRVPFGARRLDAATVYLLTAGIDAFGRYTMYTVLTIYYVMVVGMNPLQLVLVGTVLEATVLLLEVPTGIIADVYSRRLSVILGYLLVGVGFVIEGSVPLFAMILMAEMIRAVGECCLSGAMQAWIADEVGEQRIGLLFVRGSQVRRACGLLGIGASVGLASIDLALPVLVGGVLTILLAGLLVVIMPERGFRPLRREELGGGLLATAAAGLGHLRQQPMLLVFLGIAAAMGASSEGFDRLWQAHVLLSFTLPSLGALQPIVWFGILDAVAMLLSIAAVQLLTRLDLTDDRTVARALVVVHGGWMVAVAILGLTTEFGVAVLALWSAQILRSVGQPLFAAWQTRSIPPQVRATVLSVFSQGDALGQTVGGPGIGLIGTAHALWAAILATSMLHGPAVFLLVRARRLLDVPATARVSADASGSAQAPGAG